jgi:ATP-dependent Clp protease ATP-binding subunit ClpC
LLLGILREAKDVTLRFHLSPESIRNQIDGATVIREKVSTSVDLPLSNESKHVLAHAAEEAEMMGHKHIGTEHLFLGLLREDKSFAAELLKEAGVNLKDARKQLEKSSAEAAPHFGVPVGATRHAQMIEFVEGDQVLSTTPLNHLLIPRTVSEHLSISTSAKMRRHLASSIRQPPWTRKTICRCTTGR